jgi:hypothetical protein
MSLAPDSFKGTPAEGFVFRHKQWVVTKGFKHIMPLSIDDPADPKRIEAAMIAYPEIEFLITTEQRQQWIDTVALHAGGDSWYSVCDLDNSLVFLGKFNHLHEAEAELFKQASPKNLYPKALLRWSQANAWSYVS